MKTILILATVFSVIVISKSSLALCSKSYICDDWGQNCRYQDVCHSTIDLPSWNLPPLPSYRYPGLKPLSYPALPPLGTTRCEYKVVNGYWQNVCY